MLQEPAAEAVDGRTGIVFVEIFEVCGESFFDSCGHPVEVPVAESQQEAAGCLVCEVGGLICTGLRAESFIEFEAQYEVARSEVPLVGADCELADGFGLSADSERRARFCVMICGRQCECGVGVQQF